MLEEGKGRELLEMFEKALKESDPADLGEDEQVHPEGVESLRKTHCYRVVRGKSIGMV